MSAEARLRMSADDTHKDCTSEICFGIGICTVARKRREPTLEERMETLEARLVEVETRLDNIEHPNRCPHCGINFVGADAVAQHIRAKH